MTTTSRVRRGLAAGLSAALTAGGLLVLGTTPASAAEVSVDKMQFRWGLNNEANNRAFAPGTFNLFSAGRLADPGEGGQALTDASNGSSWANGEGSDWSVTAGNVVIEKKQSDGSYAPTTWAGTKTTATGATIASPTSGSYSDHQVVINRGTGTLDADADSASVTWDGDFTVAFYSGMTFFYVSDPVLDIEDGDGTLTATVSGFASAMDDMTVWDPIAPETITLATLTDVDVTADGGIVTPEYVDVVYTPPTGVTGQTPKTSTNASYWGSFPQDFVDFQQETGAASYWYTSGLSTDPAKRALPFEFRIQTPKVSVSQTTVNAFGSTQVTVTGSGFYPDMATGTRPPLAGQPSGTYVAFGKFADTWRPSAAAPSANRSVLGATTKWAVPAASMGTIGGPSAGAIELSPNGTFTATMTVDKAALDKTATAAALKNYGIYTYPGGGAAQAQFETYTPITFVYGSTWAAAALTSSSASYGKTGIVAVAGVSGNGVAGGSIEFLLNGGVVGTVAADGNGAAVYALPSNLPVGTHKIQTRYAGNNVAHASAPSAPAVLRVIKAKSSVTTWVWKKPTSKKKGNATFYVASSSGWKPGGKVTVKLTKGKSVKWVNGGLKDGKVIVTLPKLKKGTWKVRASFGATGTHNGSSRTTSLKITK